MTAATVACLLALSAACANRGGNQPEADPPGGQTFAANQVVIQVVHIGGYTTPAVIATRPALVTIYGDGRVITPGPQITIYPAPALPNLELQRISSADVGKLASRALTAGVGSGTDYGQPGVSDMPSTVFTILTASGAETTEVYALEETTSFGINQSQKEARVKLRDLLKALTDLRSTLGVGAVTQPEPYQPTTIAAAVMPYQGPDDVGKQPEVVWPGPLLPGEPIIGNSVLSCVTVTGDRLKLVMAAAQKANTLTPWKSMSIRWSVTLRMLLPHETSCDDLGKAR